MNGLQVRLRVLQRALRALSGTSYYHQPQGLGKAFTPGQLDGYAIDLTGKTNWRGATDHEGIPLSVLTDGRKIYFTTTVAQKALGHWDRWLLEGAQGDRDEFKKLADWLVQRQDARGGWPVWADVGLDLPSPYNAMTQGQCISVFVRARTVSEQGYDDAARRALGLLQTPVEEGGTAIIEGADTFLEEVPENVRSTILNGWIFALYGLYDMYVGLKSDEARGLFQRSLETLRRQLARFDAGYWSYYSTRRSIASPFYHDLHIGQLQALAKIDPSCDVWPKFEERWRQYRRRWTCRQRALWRKAVQKMRAPTRGLIVR